MEESWRALSPGYVTRWRPSMAHDGVLERLTLRPGDFGRCVAFCANIKFTHTSQQSLTLTRPFWQAPQGIDLNEFSLSQCQLLIRWSQVRSLHGPPAKSGVLSGRIGNGLFRPEYGVAYVARRTSRSIPITYPGRFARACYLDQPDSRRHADGQRAFGALPARLPVPQTAPRSPSSTVTLPLGAHCDGWATPGEFRFQFRN